MHSHFEVFTFCSQCAIRLEHGTHAAVRDDMIDTLNIIYFHSLFLCVTQREIWDVHFRKKVLTQAILKASLIIFFLFLSHLLFDSLTFKSCTSSRISDQMKFSGPRPIEFCRLFCQFLITALSICLEVHNPLPRQRRCIAIK